MNRHSRHLKDPGSAITHFIGMLMAIFAAVPLLIKAAREPDHIYLISLSIYALSLILLYAASTTYHTFDLSERANTILKKIDHMMIFVLIAGSYTPICLITLKGRTGTILLALVWGIAIVGIILKAFWVFCPKWVLPFSISEWAGYLCSCFHSDFKCPFPGSIRMASCGRYHLYNRRCHLCTEASDFQQPPQKFRFP